MEPAHTSGPAVKSPVLAAIVLSLATGAIASSSNRAAIEDRIAGFRDIGSAHKNIGDELRSAKPNKQTIRNSAQIISRYSTQVGNWFPPDSQPPREPERGLFETIRDWFSSWWSDDDTTGEVESHAKKTIWSKPKEFSESVTAFQREARKLNQITLSGTASQIGSQYRRLGATCKACHDQFREPLD